MSFTEDFVESYIEKIDVVLNLDEKLGHGFSGVLVMFIMLAYMIWYRLLRKEDEVRLPDETKSAYEPYEPWEMEAIKKDNVDFEHALRMKREDRHGRPKIEWIKLSDEHFDSKVLKGLQNGDLVKCKLDVEVQRTHEKHRGLQVRNFGTKGRGYAAGCEISPGTLLLDETGFFAMSTQDKKMTAAVLTSPELMEGLSTCSVKRCADKVSFLTDYTFEEWTGAWKKVQANKFCVRAPGGDAAAGMIFLEASLFNHSCGPNACVEFPFPGRIQVTACEDIQIGEEICIDYSPAGGSTGEAFICECDACSFP